MVGLLSANRLPSRLPHEQLGREKGNRTFSEKVVPITRDFLHYIEPGGDAVKRKNEQRGSHNGPACRKTLQLVPPKPFRTKPRFMSRRNLGYIRALRPVGGPVLPGDPLFFNSWEWSCGPRPGHENTSRAARRWLVDGARGERSAPPGAVRPIHRWILGALWHDRVSLPVGKHVDQPLQSQSTPLGRSSPKDDRHGRHLSPLL
jgi:hypothetical protein